MAGGTFAFALATPHFLLYPLTVIISASRRTDIPAFYAEWMMNRLRAGSCAVPNPFNRDQVSRVSLRPEDVEVIVFWTRHARPLLAHLDELERRGYRFYFLYTLVDYPRPIERGSPGTERAVRTFRELSERIGPERVVWRYDPILFGDVTGPDFHRERFGRLTERLAGHTRRVVVSVVDIYRKLAGRLRDLEAGGARLCDESGLAEGELAELMTWMAERARAAGLEIASCAETLDLAPYGIRPGKCIDDGLIREVFGIDVTSRKDPAQRRACGCVASRDIGMYDSCVFGCSYCYATTSFERAWANRRAHDPRSPSLIGWTDAPAPKADPGEGDQLELWR